MEPTTLPLHELIGQALSGLLLIPMIWYAVREIKSQLTKNRQDMDDGFAKLGRRIHQIELTVASDSTKHDVRHLKEAYEKIEEVVDRLALAQHDTTRAITAIWTKIGDRPDDNRNRGG